MWQITLWRFIEIVCRCVTFTAFTIAALTSLYLWLTATVYKDSAHFILLSFLVGVGASFLWCCILYQRKYCAKVEDHIEDHCYKRMDEKFEGKIPDCTICMIRPQSVVFNCGHSAVCRVCVRELRGKECHLCREPLVTYTRGIYQTEEYYPELDSRLENNQRLENTQREKNIINMV